jgi:hypothetical protein
MEAALYGNQPPERPRKSRARWWIIGGVVAGVVICLALALLAPFAYLTFNGRVQAPGSLSRLEPLACPGAVARDTVPTDASGQFTVQPLYRETLVYAGDSRTAPASQRADLWAKDVLGPYPPMDDIFTESVGGIDAWQKELGAVDPNTFRCLVYDMQQADLTDHALNILQADAKQIPGPTTFAYLVPWYSTTFGGASQEQSLLIPIWEISPLDRTLPRVKSDFAYMDFPLDHEYLEVARYDRLGSVTNAYLTLLDNMVTDGMADQFGAHMTGRPIPQRISSAQESQFWTEFEPHMNDYANPDQGADMLGDPARGIPDGVGYQIGDHIVGDYLARHPKVTFNQLVAMDAQTIFAGSGYNG